jgi:hypothetical protein
MGYSVLLYPQHELGVVRLSGEVDGYELPRLMRSLALAPGWAPGFRVAWDVRHVRAFDLATEHVDAFAAMAGDLSWRVGPGRSAFLVRDAQGEATVRLLRQWWGGDPRRDLRPFRSVGEATAWLGVPEEVLEQAA